MISLSEESLWSKAPAFAKEDVTKSAVMKTDTWLSIREYGSTLYVGMSRAKNGQKCSPEKN